MITIKPRYQETDQMGIIHHSAYYAWFELARDHLFEKLLVPYSLFEDHHIHMKVLESHCKYIQSAQYGRLVKVQADLVSCNGVRTLIKYKVFDQDALLTDAEITYVFTDFNGKIINMKKHYPELIKDMI